MTDHLALAREFIAKGEDYYRRAADEIIAAQRDDPTLGYDLIAGRVGKGATWCRDLVQWRTNPRGRETPYGGDEHNARSDRGKAKRILRDADPETVERIVSELPPERRDLVANAAAKADAYEGRIPVEGTAAGYLRDPAPDPSQYEIDHLALDLARRARELRDRIRRFGVRTMGDAGDTLRDLESAAEDVGEARAAVIEHVNERALR